MGWFQSFGQLVDELIEWLGATFSRWIESLIGKIKRVWQGQILPIIQKTFGFVSEVYVLFFQTYQGIVKMMTWSENKEPVMFEVEKAPSNIPLPTQNQMDNAPKYKLALA